MKIAVSNGYHLIGFLIGSLAAMSFNFVVKFNQRLIHLKFQKIGTSWGKKREKLGSLHVIKTCSLRLK